MIGHINFGIELHLWMTSFGIVFGFKFLEIAVSFLEKLGVSLGWFGKLVHDSNSRSLDCGSFLESIPDRLDWCFIPEGCLRFGVNGACSTTDVLTGSTLTAELRELLVQVKLLLSGILASRELDSVGILLCFWCLCDKHHNCETSKFHI